MDDKALYDAFMAKDARFDGRFFVGIASTGIYCRPVCRARPPKAENCRFFPTAAGAEQAGYRPCLLCRPELAPGESMADARAGLARRAAALLEESCGSPHSVEAVAQRLGCSARHLRRVFSGEYGVPPVQYLQTCRLLLAKSLLTDTSLPVLDVAMAAGFGSLRRFNSLFKAHYGLAPTALRRRARAGSGPAGEITLLLGYRPPYRWETLLAFLAARAIPGVEAVREGAYLRTVRLQAAGGNEVRGTIAVRHRHEKNALAVTLSESLLPVLPQVLARVKRLFDLHCDTGAVFATLGAMNTLRPGLCVEGTRLPGCFDAFEMAVRAVLGQQVTVKAARTLAARMAATFGTPFETGVEGLTHLFPSPACMLALGEPLAEHLGLLGVTSARAGTIRALAQGLADGTLDFEGCAAPEAEMGRLLAIKGIGGWTAQYIAMRAMGWPDAFLETDAGVKKALVPRTAKEMLALAEGWRPWRSYAVMNLWNAPGQGG